MKHSKEWEEPALPVVIAATEVVVVGREIGALGSCGKGSFERW